MPSKLAYATDITRPSVVTHQLILEVPIQLEQKFRPLLNLPLYPQLTPLTKPTMKRCLDEASEPNMSIPSAVNSLCLPVGPEDPTPAVRLRLFTLTLGPVHIIARPIG